MMMMMMMMMPIARDDMCKQLFSNTHTHTHTHTRDREESPKSKVNPATRTFHHHFFTFHTPTHIILLNPPHPLQDSPRLVGRHATNAQRAYLSAPSQALQADSDFPAFFVGQDEDVAFAFLVADAGSEDVQGFEFAGLDGRLEWMLVKQKQEKRRERMTEKIIIRSCATHLY